MNLFETRKGEITILSKSLIASFFPITTILSFSYLPPFFSLFFSSGLSLIFFAILITLNNNWKELWNKNILLMAFAVSLLIGVGFYGLFFIGLKRTTAGNASLISLMEIFFSFLLFNVWKKEYFSSKHLLGITLMLCGGIFVLLPKSQGLHSGDTLILIATFFAPFGNNIQQKLRKKISSESILFLRCLLSLPFIILLAWIFKERISWTLLQKSTLFLLYNGILFFGLTKILWLEGIHRISVTKASALNSTVPFLTLIWASIFLKQTPTIWQISALIPLIGGILLLTSKSSETKKLDEN